MVAASTKRNALLTGSHNTDLSEHGLFRQTLGGSKRTLRAAFEAVFGQGPRPDVLRDARHSLAAARIDLSPADGQGFWRFLSVRDEIFAVLTECDFAQGRIERVCDEGLIEFHFILGGPVALSLSGHTPTADDRRFGEATLIACRNAPGVEYAVHCPAGPTRMIGLYVEPALLGESFALRADGVAAIRKLLDPRAGTITVLDQRLDQDVVQTLMGLRAIRFENPQDLLLAMAKLYELIYFVTAALLSRKTAETPTVEFTQRELQMFERARERVTTELGRPLTVNDLARELGTNATKLKSGFKLLYGTTLFNYRLRLRMEYAMQLLMERKLPISEVARASGYERQASFTSAFKAHYGLLPKAARQLQGRVRPSNADEPPGAA